MKKRFIIFCLMVLLSGVAFAQQGSTSQETLTTSTSSEGFLVADLSNDPVLRESIKLSWQQVQKDMQAEFDRIKALENTESDSAKIIKAWKKFQKDYSEDNPYSSRDDRLRDHARNRISFWQGGGSSGGSSLSSSSALTKSALVGTVWKEICPGSNPPKSFIRLRSDGKFEYNYAAPHSFKFDGTDHWYVTGGNLIISWTNGYAITSYRKVDDINYLHGKSTKSCRTEARLERVR